MRIDQNASFRSWSGARNRRLETNIMASQKGPNIKKKQKCKNCEGKGLLKKGDKVVKCQRCGGTGLR
jgi:DnaJ-class molecular chaperone